MRFMLFSAVLLLAGCAEPPNAAFQSAQFPPNSSAKSEPQPLGSLPSGATNPSNAPGAMEPNFLSFTFGLGRG